MSRLGTVCVVSRRRELVRAVATCVVLAWSCLGVSAASPGRSRPEAKPQMQAHHPIIVSEFSTHDRQPDGDLDTPFWSTARQVNFDQAAFTRIPYPQSETHVASRWSRHFLYLAFWCRYETLNMFDGEDPDRERWELWDKDVVEAFIAPDAEKPSRYFEFEVAPNNQWIDLAIDLTAHPFNNAQWNSGFEHATRVDAARHLWTSEWRIPLNSLARSGITPDGTWRVNFYRSDGAAPNRRAMSWGALPRKLPSNSFHQPESFGVLRFAQSRAAQKAH